MKYVSQVYDSSSRKTPRVYVGVLGRAFCFKEYLSDFFGAPPIRALFGRPVSEHRGVNCDPRRVQ